MRQVADSMKAVLSVMDFLYILTVFYFSLYYVWYAAILVLVFILIVLYICSRCLNNTVIPETCLGYTSTVFRCLGNDIRHLYLCYCSASEKKTITCLFLPRCMECSSLR